MNDTTTNIPITGEPDGTLTIIARTRKDGKPTFQARRIVPMELRKNPRNPYVTKSLGKVDKTTAFNMAVQWEREIFTMINLGESPSPMPFSEMAKGYLTDRSKRSKELDRLGKPLCNPNSLIRETTSIKRYLIPYFGDTDLRRITDQQCRRYIKWRQDYYITGAGKDQTHIEYIRGGELLRRPIKKATVPAASTVGKDCVAFNKVMEYASLQTGLSRRSLSTLAAPKPENTHLTRRPRFLDEQVDLILSNALISMTDCEGRTWYWRHQLSGFMTLLLGTGIRVSEAYCLQFKNIQLEAMSKEQWEARRHHYVSSFADYNIGDQQSHLPTSNGQRMEFRVAVTRDNAGLKSVDHARRIVPTQMFSEEFLAHLKFVAMHVCGLPPESWQDIPKDQHLFCHPHGKRVGSLSHGFNSLLEMCDPDGLESENGNPHTLSSFRHTYASRQIEAGAARHGLGFLAANMGTSEEMIRKHYAQILHEQRSDELQMI